MWENSRNTLFHKTFLGVLTACLCASSILCGCGKTQGETGETPGKAQTPQGTDISQAGEKKEDVWGIADYRDNLFHTPAGVSANYHIAACWGERYYCLRELQDASGEISYGLGIYDAVSDTASDHVIDLSGVRLPDESSLAQAVKDSPTALTGMDAGAAGMTLFFQQQGDEGKALHFYAVHLDENLQADRVTDLNGGLSDACGKSGAGYSVREAYMDGEGRYQVLLAETMLVLLDGDGNFLCSLDGTPDGDFYTCFGKQTDGSPIYLTNSEKESLFVFDGKKKVLGSGEGGALQRGFAGQDGRLLCISYNGGLFSWDMTDREAEKIFDDNSVSLSQCDAVLPKGEDEILLIFYEKGNAYYNVLAKGGASEATEIKVASFLFSNQYLMDCAAEFSRRHPGIDIRVTEPEDYTKREDEWNAALAELTAGGGADLMIVTRSQLKTLKEKGIAADLSTVLPQETLSQIVPGALEYGTVDGKLYGVVSSASVSALLVSDDVCEGDSWTAEDVLRILEEREKSGNPVESIVRREYNDAPHMILGMLALGDRNYAGCLDPETGKCDFDSQRFKRILETCAKYGRTGTDTNLSTKEQAEAVREKRAVAMSAGGSLMNFSSAFASLGESYHTIGYPAQEGKGYRLDCNSGCAAVNVKSEEKREAIDAFLAFLIDYDTQKQFGTQWVRLDVLRDSVTDCVELYGNKKPCPVFHKDERSVIALDGKEDGTSYLPEYLEVFCSAHPEEEWAGAVNNIILEEAAYYFEGAKSVDETAKVIQNRVQLYLNERQ